MGWGSKWNRRRVLIVWVWIVTRLLMVITLAYGCRIKVPSTWNLYDLVYQFYLNLKKLPNGVILFMPLQQISKDHLSSGDQWADLALPEGSKTEFGVHPWIIALCSLVHISHPQGLTCSPCTAQAMNKRPFTPETMMTQWDSASCRQRACCALHVNDLTPFYSNFRS